MGLTEGVVHFELGCPCRFQHLGTVCVFGKFRQPLVEVTGIVHRGSRTGVDLLPDRDDEVFRLCGGVPTAKIPEAEALLEELAGALILDKAIEGVLRLRQVAHGLDRYVTTSHSE